MTISDLFEQFINDEHTYTKYNHEKKEILDYDLADDVFFYINHNDDIYRRLIYPIIVSKNIDYRRLKTAIQMGYREYMRDYDIRILPKKLDDKMLTSICQKFSEYLNNDTASQ